MKTLLSTAIALCMTSSIVSADNCSTSLADIVQKSMYTESYTTSPIFRTHHIINVNNQVFLIYQGRMSSTGHAVHVLAVEGNNGTNAIVTGNISVVDNVTLYSEFCVQDVIMPS